MSFRVILESEALAGISKQCLNTQLAPRSKHRLSHGGEQLSGVVKSPRRSLRHSSLHTASDSRKSKNCSTRIVRRQSLAPLSHRPCRLPSVSHPRKSGSSTSNTSTSTAHTAGNQSSPPPVREHLGLSDHRYTSVTMSQSRAKLLLSQARHVIALRTDWLGRKLSIMDVILDSRSPARDFDEDALIEAIRRIQELTCPLRCQYNITDELSFSAYWADEAARWGMRTFEGMATRFPDSDERSTASWSPSLDEQRLGS